MKHKKYFSAILCSILISFIMLFLLFVKENPVISSPESELREALINGGQIPDGVIDTSALDEGKKGGYDYKKDPTIVNKNVTEFETINILGHLQKFSVMATYGPNPCTAIFQGGHAFYSLRFWPYYTDQDRFVYVPKIINYWVEFRDDNGRTLIRFEGSKRFDASTDGVWIYELYDPSVFKDKIGNGRFRMYYEIWFNTSDPGNVMIFNLTSFENKERRTEIANRFFNRNLLLSSRAGGNSSAENSVGTISGSACMGISSAGGKTSGGGDNNGGCPVNIATGILVEDYVDLAYPSGYKITKHFNSGLTYNLGHSNWMFNFQEFLRFDLKDGSINYRNSSFKEYRFIPDIYGPVNVTYYTGNIRYKAAASWNFLKMNKDGENYVITFPNQSKKVFNAWGYLIKEIDPQGNQTVYTWGLSAKMILRSYTDNSAGMPLELTALMGPGPGNSLVITDPYNRKIYVTFEQGQVSKITDWAGRITQYSWHDGFMTGYKDAEGGYTEFLYQENIYVQLKGIKYPNGMRIWNEYLTIIPPNGMLIREQRMSNGGYINYKYGWIESSGGASAAKTETWKSNQNNLWTEIDESGRQVKYYYDVNSNIIRTDEPGSDGSIVHYTFTYDHETLLMTSKKDPFDRVARYYYDGNGNLTKLVKPDNTEIRLAYNDKNYLTDYYDTSGRHMVYDYDSKNNLISFTDKLGKKWYFDYDQKGRLIKFTDANGYVWRYEYDSYGNIASITDEEGGYLFARYNEIGMPIFINVNDLKFELKYNNFNKLTEIKDAHGNTTKFSYDGNGNLISFIDAENNTLSMIYDAFNMLRQSTDAKGANIRLDYNYNNRITSVIDPENRNVNFGYSGNGAYNITSKKDQLNRVTYYEYDGVGNLTSVRTPSANLYVEYRYDALNRLIRKIGDNTIYYDRDETGKIIKITDDLGSTSYEYDAMGRILKKEYPFKNKSVELRYDDAGNLDYKKNFAGDKFHFAYDRANKLVSITRENEKALRYTYNKNSNLVRVEYPNKVNLFITYDELKNINRMKYISDNGEILYMVEYEYNKLDKIIQKKSLGLHRNMKDFRYTYDETGKLKQVKLMDNLFADYNYNNNSNRIYSRTSFGALNYSYDEANQLKNTDNSVHSYDNDGNVISTNISGKRKVYKYDRLNNLKRVEYQGDDNFIEYKYDGTAGLRTEKYSSKTKEKTYALWFGRVIEGEITESGKLIFANYGYGFRNSQGIYYYITDIQGSVVGVTDKDGSLAAVYEYDEFGNPLISATEVKNTENPQDMPAVSGQPSAQKEISKTEPKIIKFLKNMIISFKKYFTIQKNEQQPPRGNTEGPPPLPDTEENQPQNSQAVNTAARNTPSFGAAGNTSFANKVESPLKYAGYYYDEDLELYYLQSRYYDPKTGRFTQADKIGYAVGLNLYVYCDNDPVNYIDSYGMAGEIQPLPGSHGGQHTGGQYPGPNTGNTAETINTGARVEEEAANTVKSVSKLGRNMEIGSDLAKMLVNFGQRLNKPGKVIGAVAIIITVATAASNSASAASKNEAIGAAVEAGMDITDPGFIKPLIESGNYPADPSGLPKPSPGPSPAPESNSASNSSNSATNCNKGGSSIGGSDWIIEDVTVGNQNEPAAGGGGN